MILEHMLAEQFRDGFLTGLVVGVVFCTFVYIVLCERRRDKNNE